MKWLVSFVFLLSSFVCSSQQLEWANVINSTAYDYGYLIDVDDNGNTYVSGFATKTLTFVPPSITGGYSSNEILLAKYDPSGNLVWGHLIGHSGYDQGWAMKVTGNGDIYLTGIIETEDVDFDMGPGIVTFPPTPPQTYRNNDMFVVKYDTDGNFIWGNAFGDNLNFIDDLEQGKGIDVDSNGSVYITGYFNGTVDFNPTGTGGVVTSSNIDTDIFFLKLNSLGQFQWVKQIGGTSNTIEVESLKVDSQKNFYIIGKHSGDIDADPSTAIYPLSGTRTFVAKYNENGDFVWARQMPTNVTSLWGLEINQSDRIFVSGMRSGDIWFARISPLNSGTIWERQLVCAGLSGSFCISSDQFNNVYVGGFFSSTADLDPSTQTFNVTSNGLYNAFFAKYTPSGNFICGGAFGDSYIDQIYSIASDANGDIYVTGIFEGTSDVDLNPNSTVFIVDQYPAFGIFVLKYRDTPILLPVEFMGIEASYVGNDIVHVKWSTASESNNDYFQAERSVDNIYWNPVTTIDGQGNSQQNTYYNIDDNISLVPHSGVIYYRIKQVDFNGDFDYSSTVSVDIKAQESKVYVYPNPTHSILNISEDVMGYSYEIISKDFKTVQSGVFLENNLNVSMLSSGKYYVIITKEDYVLYTISFIKL